LNWTLLVDGLLPAHCQFCGEAQAGPVCAPCQADLPWNQPACPGCALPQAFSTGVSPVTGVPLPPAGEGGTQGGALGGVRALPLPGLLCPACQQKPRAFDAAFAAFRYAAPGSQALQGLKYGARFHEARWLAESLASTLRQRQAPLPQRLIPVPLHRGRLLRRGYNQAQELARQLGKALNIPVAPGLARRLRATPDQIGLSAAQRRRNLRGAFAVSTAVAGLHLALLDDVMTTGATLEELARACKAAGATRVEAWALARQPLGKVTS
jgi:ComF family protein